MADNCAVCFNSICTATWDCGNNHRTCLSCFLDCRDTARRNDLPLVCPMCRGAATKAVDTTAIQLHSATMQQARNDQIEVRIGVTAGDRKELQEQNVVEFIRRSLASAVANIKASYPDEGERAVTYQRLQQKLGSKLSRDEYNSVFTELVKDADMLEVLQNIDKKMCATKIEKSSTSRTLIRAMHDPDNKAIVMKTSVNSFFQIMFSSISGGVDSLAHATAADVLVAGFMMVAFNTAEIYKYRAGEISGLDCLRNIVEHTVGCTASVAGCVAGGGAGAYIGGIVGSSVPIIGTVMGVACGTILGSVIGSSGADFTARKAFRSWFPGVKSETTSIEVEREIRLTMEEKATEAAVTFKISLKHNSFSEAKKRFRRVLIANHPDRFNNRPQDIQDQQKKKVMKILSDWAIVRLYYKEYHVDNGCEVDEDEGNDEGFVHINTLKQQVQTSMGVGWKIVRCWFGDNNNIGRPLSKNEKIETVELYV